MQIYTNLKNKTDPENNTNTQETSFTRREIVITKNRLGTHIEAPSGLTQVYL